MAALLIGDKTGAVPGINNFFQKKFVKTKWSSIFATAKTDYKVTVLKNTTFI